MVAVKSIPILTPAKPQSSIKKFSTIPEQVQAVQFSGYESAVDIFGFTEGFFLVPRGYEHGYRKPEEFDKNSGKVLTNAAEFLLFNNGEGVFRIDLSYWIVKKANGDLQVFSADQFAKTYSEDTF